MFHRTGRRNNIAVSGRGRTGNPVLWPRRGAPHNNSREAPKPANTIMQRLAPYRGIAITFGALLLWSADAAAEPSPAERRGLRFVRLNCARCHAVDKVSPSPLANAPPFRTLHLKYPVSDLQRPWLRGSIR